MKKIATILTFALLLASTAAQAQIYLMDGEDNTYRDPDVESWVVNPATYNEGTDSYTPLGSGVLLLAALGGAYLMGKRRRKATWEARSGSADSPLPPPLSEGEARSDAETATRLGLALKGRYSRNRGSRPVAAPRQAEPR